MRRGLAAAGLLAISIDWPATAQELLLLFRDPAVKASPKTIPKDQPIYKAQSREKAPTVHVPTVFESEADYLIAVDRLHKATDLASVRAESQTALFGKLGARVAFGESQQKTKWEQYALTQAERITGIPASQLPESMRKIEAQYGTPDVETARYATNRSFAHVAPVPLVLLRRLQLSEVLYVSGLKLHTEYFDETVDNGATDTTHGGVIVNCLNRGKLRKGVGQQLLHQLGFSVDAYISNTPTPFNDPEFASLIPGLAGISQHQLDYPKPSDSQVFDIAVTKAVRFEEILSGELILPGDDEFYFPEQAQQELLLRRLYGTCPDIAPGYFEDLTLFKREHGELPLWGGQLTQ